MKHICMLLLALWAISGLAALGADRQPFVLQRDGWNYDRSDIIWYAGKAPEKKAQGIKDMFGWAEYNFSVPT
ncbi:MAG TPA: hypothetical protein VGL77_17690, partial [Armatimonadota bacterium]